MQFKLGDAVYDYRSGWGNVTKIRSNNYTYPVVVDFGGNINDVEYTECGKFNKDDINPTLSFTEYTLQGFSQERPIELPEVGEEIMVSDNGVNWIIKKFKEYQKRFDDYPIHVESGSNYKFFKRLR